MMKQTTFKSKTSLLNASSQFRENTTESPSDEEEEIIESQEMLDADETFNEDQMMLNKTLSKKSLRNREKNPVPLVQKVKVFSKRIEELETKASELEKDRLRRKEMVDINNYFKGTETFTLGKKEKSGKSLMEPEPQYEYNLGLVNRLRSSIVTDHFHSSDLKKMKTTKQMQLDLLKRNIDNITKLQSGPIKLESSPSA